MKLSRIQLKVLNVYRGYRDGSLVLGFLRQCVVPWGAFFLIGTALYFIYSKTMPRAAWFLLGSCVGAVFRDLGRLQLTYRTWSVISHVINWERVEELIHENGKPEM